jgi:hypothetical protein
MHWVFGFAFQDKKKKILLMSFVPRFCSEKGDLFLCFYEAQLSKFSHPFCDFLHYLSHLSFGISLLLFDLCFVIHHDIYKYIQNNLLVFYVKNGRFGWKTYQYSRRRQQQSDTGSTAQPGQQKNT